MNSYNPINDNYELLENAYKGSGGFIDGSYLVPHVRETADKYSRRQALSYYANYVAPVVNSLVDPIFRKTAVRDWDGRKIESTMFSNFQKDVDRRGTKIAKFMKRAAKIAQLHAVCFIVVDNVPELAPNIEAAIKKRQFPYAYTVKPQQIKAYQCNKSGILTSITYEIFSRQATGIAVTKITERWTWTETTWKREADHGTSEGEHNLGIVPVIPLFSTDTDDGDMLPISEMVSIARTNLAIFNISSELRELLRNQAFAILTYPITKNTDKTAVDKLVTGTENMLGYDGEASTSPDFIAPPADQAALLQNELQRLVEEIYRMASLTSVVGVQQKTSGVAKEWDFEQTNQVLADLSDNCEDAENRIAKLFELWTNTTIDYVCQYPDDFGIVDIVAKLDEVTKALDLAIGGKFNIEVKRKAAEVALGDIPEDRFDAVINDIEQMEEEQIQTNAIKADDGK